MDHSKRPNSQIFLTTVQPLIARIEISHHGFNLSRIGKMVMLITFVQGIRLIMEEGKG
jgi:hypothetical protein